MPGMLLHTLHYFFETVNRKNLGLTNKSVWSISSEVLTWTRILSPETADVEIQKIMELLKEKIKKQGVLHEGEISHSCLVLKQGR